MDKRQMSPSGGPASSADRAKALPASRYEALDLNRLVVFTLGWLMDTSLPPTFENVSVAAFRLFPSKFSLRGYDHPDSNRVNRALLQLGPKYRNWAVGSTGTGYNLTPLGEKVLADARQRLASGSVASHSKPRRSQGYTWDPATEISDLKNTEAYRRFREGGVSSLNLDDVWHALGAFRYTPKEAIRERIVALKAIAAEPRDSDAIEFLEALRNRFDRKPK